MSGQPTPALELVGVTKRFGPVAAVREVSFAVAPGEVVALAGENGAGKSTLKNLIGGLMRPDEGEIRVSGAPRGAGVAGVRAQGVSTVHQEISLFPHLSVAENLMINHLDRYSAVNLRPGRIQADAAVFLERVGAGFTADRIVSTLSTGQRQLVEIAKALVDTPRVLVLDEPTSSLNLAGDVPTSDLTRTELEELMVGRELAAGYPELAEPGSEIALAVSGLGDGEAIRDVSFEIRAGEVFGLAGLMGSGRTEVARAVFGLARRTGTVTVRGHEIADGPRHSISAGIAFVTEDRRDEGIYLARPIRETLSSVVLPQRLRALGLVDRKAERASAARRADEMQVSARGGLEAPGGSLSGGNQQKVVIAKWLAASPQLLILDEPTRGIDVGAKAEIYRVLVQLAAAGVAILLISSEMEEVLGLSHRVGVMAHGRLAGVLDRSEASQARVIRLATEEADE
jgi:rhamnose transport system ATP-binding protein